MSVSISTHVLDATDGTHAAGIGVRLTLAQTGAVLFAASTDSGGRLTRALEAPPVPGTLCDLTFDTGPYWRERGMPGALQAISLRFALGGPDARHHLPIILGPHGYSGWFSMPEPTP